MIRVVLYTRRGCKLCEEVAHELQGMQELVPHRLVEVDIDTDPALQARYAEAIPVVEVGPYTLRAPISRTDLRISLQAAQQGGHTSPELSGGQRTHALRLNRLVYLFSKHWLALFNLFVFFYVSLPFAAPVLMNAGAIRPARWIYAAYSPLCHQLGYRSWFLFGEQSAYPTSEAGLPLRSFESVTGINPEDLWASRAFIGDETLGYKVALCERDVAIYGGILFAGIAFGLLRNRVRPLPVLVWLVIGILPIALDGGIQLMGQLPGWPLPPRESTPLFRSITGGLFGVMNVWLAYPYVEEAMVETRALTAAKLASADQGLASEASPS